MQRVGNGTRAVIARVVPASVAAAVAVGALLDPIRGGDYLLDNARGAARGNSLAVDQLRLAAGRGVARGPRGACRRGGG